MLNPLKFLRQLLLVVAIASASGVNITYQTGINDTLVPDGPLPPASPQQDVNRLIELFTNLGRSTVWNLVDKVRFEGDTGEPEGMVKIGDNRWFVSSNYYTEATKSYGKNIVVNGTDRSSGAGFGQILVYTDRGQQIAAITLTNPGDIEYHSGGIDYDGTYIWDAIGQYRPNSTAHVVKIDPRTGRQNALLHYEDHLGTIVFDPWTDEAVTWNWGGRNATTWSFSDFGQKQPMKKYPEFSQPDFTVKTPSFHIDYQDCKFIGHPRAFDFRGVAACAGVSNKYGGIALVDTTSLVPLYEVPINMVSENNVSVCENPFHICVVNDTLRVYFLPDQHNSTLYVYEPDINSPYEF